MAIVTPCRSDMSPAGLSSGSHLSDGRIRLIMVKKCSQIHYLRFLASIPGKGAFIPAEDCRAASSFVSPFFSPKSKAVTVSQVLY